MTTQNKPDFSEFYSVIGEGISLWSKIEYHLAIIFTYLMNDTTQAAQDCFYSLRSIGTKLDYVDIASNSGFFRPAIDDSFGKHKAWKALKTDITNEIKFRNAFAHHKLVIASGVDSKTMDQTPPTQALVRPNINSIQPDKGGIRKFQREINELITIEQAREHIERMKEITNRLEEFANPLFREIHDLGLKQLQELHKQDHHQ